LLVLIKRDGPSPECPRRASGFEGVQRGGSFSRFLEKERKKRRNSRRGREMLKE